MNPTSLYERLIESSREAFSGGFFETSYHILCAATHYAKDVENIDYLTDILQIAHEQSAWINLHATDNILSSQNVHKRGGVDLFKSLFRHIEGDILIVKTKQRRRLR